MDEIENGAIASWHPRATPRDARTAFILMNLCPSPSNFSELVSRLIQCRSPPHSVLVGSSWVSPPSSSKSVLRVHIRLDVDIGQWSVVLDVQCSSSEATI